jgi:mRNA interferase MazF
MTRGEVWWGDIPGIGRRPVLVLTRDTAIPLLAKVVVALITTQTRGIPTEVRLEPGDGMPHTSVVSFDNVYTLSKRRLVSRITELSNARLDEICEALRFAFAC